MGTSLCVPGGISSTVATMCSRPCANLFGPAGGGLSSSVNSEHPHLALEGRNRLWQMVGSDAVAEHHSLARVFGQVLDQPARVVEGPVRVVAAEQKDLLALHPLECAAQLRLVLGVVQRLG